MANRGHPGFDQDSIFALLEHADEQGEIQSTGTAADTSRLSSQASAKTNPNNQAGKKQAPVKQQAAAASRPSTGQSARAEDYYRAFEHVYRDAGLNEVVLRFHKTKIIRIRPNGDFMLTSGGWLTATTVAALNDALHALGMKVTYQPPVGAGMWMLTDDSGTQYQFKDGMVMKATKAEHSQRGNRLLKAYNGGADVPRYARKPPAGGMAGRPQAAQGAAAAAGGAQPHTGPQLQHHSAAGPRQAPADALEQLKAVMDGLVMEDNDGSDEHLCVVCLERERDEVLVPCGHMVLCHGCCADIMASSNECPICREEIVDHCTIDPNED